MPQDNTVLMEGVRIIFRNFVGKEDRFNKEGDRNFSVVLPDDAVAEQMLADGWNVKKLDPREGYEEDGVTWYLQVALRFDVFPPRIVLVTSNGRTQLSEETVGMLDWADITNVDLIVRPHFWEVNGRSGMKAYVKTMYVTIEEDALEAKYGLGDKTGDGE